MNENERTTINYYLGTGLFLILIFTALKPEGTEDANVLIRIAVWSLNIGLLLPLLIALQILLQMARSFNQLNTWIKLVLTGVLGSLLFVPLGLLIIPYLVWSSGL
jgi:general stress protein CsbA